MAAQHRFAAQISTATGTGSAGSAKVTITASAGKRIYVWWIAFYNKAASTSTLTVSGGADGATTQLVLGAGSTTSARPDKFVNLDGVPVAAPGQAAVFDSSDDTSGTVVSVAYSQF
ncbi:MAG: hypothetical protein ACE5D3_01600 [Candidatus Binatia bacterium]